MQLYAKTLYTEITRNIVTPTARAIIIPANNRRTFPVAASLLWNSLPSDIQASSPLSAFRQRLKTFFCQSFPDIVLRSYYTFVVYAMIFAILATLKIMIDIDIGIDKTSQRYHWKQLSSN